MSILHTLTDEDLDDLFAALNERRTAPAESEVFEETEYHPDPVPQQPEIDLDSLSRSKYKSLVEKERAMGVQRALHAVLGSMLAVSTEEPLPDMSGRKAPLDRHTVEAMAVLIQQRTGVRFDGSRPS